MGCRFPEHHSAGGIDLGKGGAWWPLGVAVIAAALFARVIGEFIHVLSIVLTFTGMAAIAAGGGYVALRWRLRQQRRLQVQYQPQMQPVRRGWGRQELPQQPPAVEQGGQHLHIHLGDMSAAEKAEVFRQIRGR